MFRGLPAVALAVCFAALSATAAAQSWTLTNPTGKAYENEVVRLKVNLPSSAKQGKYVVRADGKEILGQIGEYEGRKWMYVITSLAENQAIEYTVSRGRPAGGKSLVSLRRSGDAYELSSGRFAVKTPAAASGDRIPSPIVAVRSASGKWVGGGVWQTERTLGRFSAECSARVRSSRRCDSSMSLKAMQV